MSLSVGEEQASKPVRLPLVGGTPQPNRPLTSRGAGRRRTLSRAERVAACKPKSLTRREQHKSLTSREQYKVSEPLLSREQYGKPLLSREQ